LLKIFFNIFELINCSPACAQSSEILARAHSSTLLIPIFISGLYMPCICLLAGSLLIKAFAMWLRLNESIQGENSTSASSHEWSRIVQTIGALLILIHLCGILLVSGTETISYLGLELSLMTVDSISLAFFISAGVTVLLPFILRWCVKLFCNKYNLFLT